MKKLVILILCSVYGIAKVNAQATDANSTNTTTASSFLGSGASSNYDILFKRYNVNAGKITANSISLGIDSGSNSTGSGNTFLGAYAGEYNGSGSNNVYIGNHSGNAMVGSNNTFIGAYSGMDYSYASGTYTGSGNVFIGALAGSDMPETTNNRLLIANTQNHSLIWGDFALQHLKFNSKVGINGDEIEGHFGSFPEAIGLEDISSYSLFVKGGILTEEVRVSLQITWADYVFNKDYNLKTLNEVEKFIDENGHLPNVPSAKEVKENGIELGEMAKIQQEKIEELTLYVIEQNKINQSQSKEIEVLKSQMKTLLEKKQL